MNKGRDKQICSANINGIFFFYSEVELVYVVFFFFLLVSVKPSVIGICWMVLVVMGRVYACVLCVFLDGKFAGKNNFFKYSLNNLAPRNNGE